MANTSRLRTEYQHVLQLEKRSRYISVKTIGVRDAPQKYVITYTCLGITGVEDYEEPLTSNQHELDVDLSNFPESAPRMKFLTPVFHPGVAEEEPYYVALRELVPSWETPGSVAQALIHIGHMLQYKRYLDWMETPVNVAAANWVSLWAKPQGLILPGRPLDESEFIEGERPAATPAAGGPAPAEEQDGNESRGARDEGAEAGRSAVAPAHVSAAAAADPEETVVTARAPGGGSAQDTRAPAPGGPAAQAGGPVNGQKAEKPKVVFGNLSQEHERPFPVPRLLHWKPAGKKYDVKEPPFSLVITSEVLARVNAHVSTDGNRELGGFLLGNNYFCPNTKIKYVQIDNSVEAKFTSSNHVSIDLVNETFQHLLDEMGGKYLGKKIIGWYHSHPDMGAFLSPMDVEVHKHRFPPAWAVALVIDPVKRQGGFFCWREGELHEHAMMDFYELRGIKTHATLTYMPWENYQCFDAQTDAEREPKLADGARPIVIINEGPFARLKAWLYKRWYLPATALALLIILGGAWRVGWLGRNSDDPRTVNANTAATPMGTVNAAANTAAGQTPQPSASPATAAGLPPLQAPTTVSECPAGRCKVTAMFKEKVPGLKVEIDGRPYIYDWEGTDAIIDLRNTNVAKNLKNSGTGSTATLSINFSDPLHSAVSVPVTLVNNQERVPQGPPPLTAAELARLRRAERERQQREAAGRGSAAPPRGTRNTGSGASGRTRH